MDLVLGPAASTFREVFLRRKPNVVLAGRESISKTVSSAHSTLFLDTLVSKPHVIIARVTRVRICDPWIGVRRRSIVENVSLHHAHASELRDIEPFLSPWLVQAVIRTFVHVGLKVAGGLGTSMT